MSVITLKCQQNLHFAVCATCVAEKLCQECERRLKVFIGTSFLDVSLLAEPDIFQLLGV